MIVGTRYHFLITFPSFWCSLIVNNSNCSIYTLSYPCGLIFERMDYSK